MLGDPISNLKKSSDGNGLQRLLSRQRTAALRSKRHWRQQYIEENRPEATEINIDKPLILIYFRYKDKESLKVPKDFPC